MTPSDPFDRSPYAAAEEFYRREKKHSEFIDRALGPANSLQKQMEALKPNLGLFSDIQNHGTSAAVEQIGKLYDEPFKSLNLFMNSHRLSDAVQSATAFSQHHAGLLSNIRDLSRSFDTGILSTVKALQNNNTVLAVGITAAKWQEQWQSVAEQISPNLAALRTNAERVMMIDMATLGVAADHIQSSTAHILAEQAIEAQKIAEALTHADTPEDSARLFVAFVSVLATIFSRLKENTVDELRTLGLLGLLLIANEIVSLPQLQTNPSMSSEERQAYSELQDKVDNLQDGLREIVEAEGALSEEYVASLPSANLARRANIRSAPVRSARRLLIADAGTPVAILQREKRWRLVVYRDPLTDQLAQGWVYETLIIMMDDGLSQ